MNTSKNWRQLAIGYIQQNARPLEIALYEHDYEGGSPDAVVAELGKFQNEDGGFGRALEPDIRLDDSSVIATTIAFQIFRHLALPSTEARVQKAAAYLLASYDAANQVWPVIPPNVDDAPHAPWWVYKEAPGEFMANPRAEIVGYFYDYAGLFPPDMRRELTAGAIAWIESMWEAGESIEMHDLLCYIRLAESEGLPVETQDRLVERLRGMVKAAVAPDPAAWAEYGLTPLGVISSPASPFYPDLASLVPHNIEFILKGQSEDGSWSPNWNWAFASVDGWRAAERDWKGVLTLANLRLLEAFGAAE